MKLNNDNCMEIIEKSKKITLDELNSSYEMYGTACCISKMYFFYKKNGELFYREEHL